MPTDDIYTIGPGGDFDFIGDAMANPAQGGVAKDITAATGSDETLIFELIGGTNLSGTTALGRETGTGFGSLMKTSTTNRVIFRAQAGSEYAGSGDVDTSKAYMQWTTGSFNQGIITTADRHCTFQDLQFVVTGANTTLAHCLFANTGGTLQIERCLFDHTVSSSVTGSIEGSFVEFRAPEAGSFIRNCVMINRYTANTNAVTGIFCQVATHGNNDIEIYNNTILILGGSGGNKTAIYFRDGCTATTDNNYVHVESTSRGFYVGQLTSTVTIGANDATSNTEATTASLRSIPYSTDTFTSVTAGSEDLTPTAESSLANAGADLTSDGVTVDIAGTSRPQGAAFDIGAVEIAAATPDPEPSEGVTMKLETRSFSTTHTTKSATFQSSSFDVSRASEVVIALDFTLTTAGSTGGFTPSIQFNSEADGSGTWSNSVYLTDGVTTMAAVAYAGDQVTATGSQFYRLPAHGALMRVNYTYAGDRAFTVLETVTIVPVHR